MCWLDLVICGSCWLSDKLCFRATSHYHQELQYMTRVVNNICFFVLFIKIKQLGTDTSEQIPHRFP